jgi:hypothetical protein
MLRYLLIFVVGLALGGVDATEAAEKSADSVLKPLQDYIGQWKGVGQPRRGSADGGWIEEAEWRWDFSDKKIAALVFTAPKGKHLVEGRITADGAADATGKLNLKLAGKTAAGGTVNYAGVIDPAAGTLTFTAEEAPENEPHRITVRFAAEKKRLIVMLERRGATADSYLRLAEVGYTRQGSGFGAGKFEPECVVTGGVGTMPFSYKGKTYYVCCTGCRDLFDSDPDTYIAEYEAKLKKAGIKQ